MYRALHIISNSKRLLLERGRDVLSTTLYGVHDAPIEALGNMQRQFPRRYDPIPRPLMWTYCPPPRFSASSGN
jgi:hypothetical protein